MAKKSKSKKRKRIRWPKPQKFDLARTLGNISLQWNYLEVQYHEMMHCYMMEVPQDVASAIFNSMGATQKAEFFDFLIAKYETVEGLKEHLVQFRKALHIVTENRNVLQHSLPSVELRFDYQGIVYKRNRLGKPIPYKASEDDLLQALWDIEDVRGYAWDILPILHARIAWQTAKERGAKKSVNREPVYPKYLALIEKLPLPNKLIPTPLGSVPKAD